MGKEHIDSNVTTIIHDGGWTCNLHITVSPTLWSRSPAASLGEVGADAVRRPRSPEGHAGHARARQSRPGPKCWKWSWCRASGAMEEKKCFKAFQTYNLTLSTARDVKKYMKQKGVCAGKGQSASTGTRHRRPGSPFGV